MPTGDFWFFAGLGAAFIGWGLMKWLLAKADALAAQVRNLAKRVEELEADYTEPEPVRVEPKSNGASPYRR